jgi:hypothetical protein
MKPSLKIKFLPTALGVALGALLSVTSASAENVFLPDTQAKEWQSECTSCHVGFPPLLMRATDWKTLMGQLDKHFGTDASVTEKENAAIVAWLTANASANDNVQRTSPDLRVTTTPFFKREHGQLIPEGFQHPAVKTPSNCAACHANPEVGHYSHDVNLPAGIVLKPRPPRPPRPPGDSGVPPGAPPGGAPPDAPPRPAT